MLIKIVAMFRNLIISSFDATIRVKRAFHPALASRGFASDVFLVNCVQKDYRDKINVPDPVVKDLISQKHCRTNNKKKSRIDLTVKEVYFPIFRKARPFFFRVCLRGRAFRNIRKYTFVTVKSALLFFLDYQGERSTPFLSFRSELVSAVELGSPVALLRFSWCFYDVLLLEELLAPTRGYSSEFSVGVCCPVLQISDQNMSFSTPVFRPLL